MPHLPARHAYGHKPKFSSVFKLLKQWKVTLGMLSTMFFFMGQFALFTYLRPFLEIHTGVDVETLSLILLAMGVSGLIGTFVIGNILKTRLYSLLIVIPFLMMIIVISLLYFGDFLLAVFILMGFWGLLGTSAPVAW